ncbi:MAG: hypothetical protein WCJ64_10835 [Rhodospirillaceae bacterium]
MNDALASLEMLPPEPEPANPTWRGIHVPVLERDRRSQIAFIDGDRGTGKSSVLLKLIDVTLKSGSKENFGEFEQVGKLGDQGERIVWLETLDMEPLSRGTNLFAAILARIAAIVDFELENSPPVASILRCGDGRADVLAMLQQLQTDAAIVWERPDGGKHDGDADGRAFSVMRAEKAGLALHSRVEKVMKGVANLLKTRKSEPPLLFVLPVDDFDLAPRHCLELLRLIRMITSKYLFFVVAGNVRIAEAVLKLKTEGELLALAGSTPSDASGARDRAVEIAANNMRKLVPPGQQIRLAELRFDEAVNLKSGNSSSLKDELEAVKFETNQSPTKKPTISLADFLLLNDPILKGSVSGEWLAGTPRQVLDMREVLAGWRRKNLSNFPESKRYPRDDSLVVAILEDIMRQISEDWRLPYEVRQRLMELFGTSRLLLFSIEADIAIRQDWSWGMVVDKFKQGVFLSYSPRSLRVSIRSGRSEQLARERQQVSDADFELSRRLSAGIILAHDIVVALSGTYFRHSSLTYKASSNISQMFATSWGDGVNYKKIYWPMPEWWTFRDYQIFAHHWTQHLEKCENHYGLAWLTAMLEVVQREPCAPGVNRLHYERVKERLDLLRQELGRRYRRRPYLVRPARAVLLNSAMATAALLFAPEYESGLEIDESRSQGDTFDQMASNIEIQNRIRLWRARSYAEATRGGELNTFSEGELSALIAPYIALKRTNEIFQRLSRKVSSLRVDIFNNDFGYIKDMFSRSGTDGSAGIMYVDAIQKLIRRISESSADGVLSTEPELGNFAFLDGVRQGLARDHPFNRYHGGVLVPTESDIQYAIQSKNIA